MMEILYSIVMGLIMVYSKLNWLLTYLVRDVIKKKLTKSYKRADIIVGGDRPQDIKVHNEKFFHRVGYDKSLGLGESYMDGWWDCDRVDEFSARLFGNGVYRLIAKLPDVRLINYLKYHVFNLQTAKRSWEVAEKHYDLGNALYESFLDKTMNYSCGYWRNAKNLDEAQQQKMELIGKKLQLKAGMRVLDIGCGWGGLCKYLAQTYNVQVVGITVSKEGAKSAQELCKGLPVEIRVQDYRDLDEGFDRIVSVGMFEHVGRMNYLTFFEVAHKCLPKHGIFLCHTIGIDNEDAPCIEAWTNKYIFPNGILPDHRNIPEAIHNLFSIEDLHNFGADYDKTLMAWNTNFVENWPKIRNLFENPDKFYRMWNYYLLMAAGLFRSRKFHVWQIVLSKGGVPGGYLSVR